MIKHGHRPRGSATPTYGSWHAMKARCHRPTHVHFADYGGRGILVCERWKKFENFLADMGERPTGKTLDRIDPNGNYEPNNCRWATPLEQAHNHRKVSWSIVDEIRGRHEHGERGASIARRFAMSKAMTYTIIRNETWRDETMPHSATGGPVKWPDLCGRKP